MRERDRLPGEPFDYRRTPVPLGELEGTAESAHAGDQDGYGIEAAVPPTPNDFIGAQFTARITAYDAGTNRYSFQEVQLNTGGTDWDDLPAGYVGEYQAVERNGNASVPIDAVVRVRFSSYVSDNILYEFSYNGISLPAGSTVTYDNVTFTGTTNLSSITQTVTNNSSLTVNSGKTFTFTGAGTYVYDGASFSVTNNSSFTIQSGKTLTVAGPGSFYISAPTTLDAVTFSVTNNSSFGISSGKTLEVTGPGSFKITAPMRYPPTGLTLSNGNNTLALSSLTQAMMRITGPSAVWAINATSGSPSDGDTFWFINASGYAGKLTGSSFTLVGGYDFLIPDGMMFGITYDGTSSKWRPESTSTMYGITASDLSHNKSSDISSASPDLTTATGDYAHVTGTTAITALGTATSGVVRDIIFDGILTLTHNSTSLILPTGANITTAAGDAARFRSEGSGNWRCLFYQRKNGTALASSGGVTQADFAISGTYTITNSWAVINDGSANLEIALPAAGTYFLWAQVKVKLPTGGASDASIEMYDSTAASAIAGARSHSHNDNTRFIKVTMPLFATYVSPGANTIQVRAQYTTGGGAQTVESDTDGTSKVGYLRIA